MAILTLTTDFGLKDGFVGTMKGVILGICPGAQLVDLTHTITPQNVLESAFALWRAYSFFPPETVHLAVIDPGVGTERRPIATRIGPHFFVGPDNGLFTPIYEDALAKGWKVEIIHLTNEVYWLQTVSRTFHGRDIFAPVAAHLASGVPITDLGLAIHNPIRIQFPKPEKTPTGWRAHVTVGDVFGNCTTDLPATQIEDLENVTFRVLGHEVRRLVTSYGHRQTGNLVALVDSENYLEIAVVNGSAAQVLGAKVGDVVDVIVQ